MFDLVIIVSIICTVIQIVKEKTEKPIPAENWANKKLYYSDIASGVSVEQRMKNVRAGRYRV